MNTIFVIHRGRVEAQEPIEYWNIVRRQAMDSVDELGGELFDRQAASQYLDAAWRPNLDAYNYETGEREPVEVSDDQWVEYREDLLDEVEKLTRSIYSNSL